jgi:hypothetical protein
MTDTPAAPAPATPAAEALATPAAPPTREWMTGLPADLTGDATLSRYDSIEALARGHVETKKALGEAGNRLAIPAADAPPEQWEAVFKAIGRPDDASGYKFPEGADAQTVEGFGPVAHQLGLSQKQAEGLAAYDMQRMTDAMTAIKTASEADLKTLKDELGSDYTAKEAVAQAAFQKLFGNEAGALADHLDGIVGSRALVEGFMKLGTMLGEHSRIDGEGEPITGVSDAEAEAKLQTLFKDKGWRDKLNAGDATTKAEHERLMAAARRHAAQG